MTFFAAELNASTVAAAMPLSAAARSVTRIHPCGRGYVANRSWRAACEQKPQSLHDTDPGRDRGARRKVG